MNLTKYIKSLCSPAMFYFYISMFAVFLMFFQNMGNVTNYSVGSYSCDVPSTIVLFIFKILYILFWTYILNLICKDGYNVLSWLLVLFPFILFFVLIGVIMMSN